MDATLTEDQQLLRETVERIAEDLSPASVAGREAADPAPGWAILADTGLLCLGGADAGGPGTAFEAAIVAEAFGRHLCPVPFAGAVLAAQLLAAAGADDVVDAIGTGARRVALALSPDLHRPGGGDGALAWDCAGASEVVWVEGDTVAVAPIDGRRVNCIDPTRHVVELVVGTDPVTTHPAGGPEASDRWTAFALAVLCADMVGVMQGALDLAVAHGRDRVQFGQRIGSFQAVQHLCAEQLVSLEAARSATYHAAWAVDGLEPVAALAAARTAKAYVSAEAVTVAESAIQVLGGIGHTWESTAHLYLRRALLDRATLGDETTHLATIAVALTSGRGPAADASGARSCN